MNTGLIKYHDKINEFIKSCQVKKGQIEIILKVAILAVYLK